MWAEGGTDVELGIPVKACHRELKQLASSVATIRVFFQPHPIAYQSHTSKILTNGKQKY